MRADILCCYGRHFGVIDSAADTGLAARRAMSAICFTARCVASMGPSARQPTAIRAAARWRAEPSAIAGEAMPPAPPRADSSRLIAEDDGCDTLPRARAFDMRPISAHGMRLFAGIAGVA